mgnify:CR=1 FL=1
MEEHAKAINTKFYYGWVIVAVSGLAMLFSAPGQTFSVSVFIDAYGEEFDYSDSNYYVTSNWRLLATMNTYDKASLYEMSYAFMRRFAFIDVGVPTDQIGVNLIRDYMAKWEEVSIEEVRSHLEDLADMWRVLNEGKRSIGPAIIKDMLLFLQENNGEDGLLNALKLYVLPQLEGMVKQNQKDVLSALGEELELQEEMPRVAKQRFEIDLTAGNE